MKPKKKRKTGMACLCVAKAVHARVKALGLERHQDMPYVTGELLTAALNALDDEISKGDHATIPLESTEP